MTSPHLTAWDYGPTREEGCSFAIYPATTSEPLAYVAKREGAEDIARVMAAGPELVKAAQDVLAGWYRLASSLPQNDAIEALDWAEFSRLRAVIAKARGVA